jgi:hypothetical protein
MIANILATLKTLFRPDDVVELRALGVTVGKRREVQSGYFDDHNLLARWAADLSPKADGIYVTLNPINRNLLARRSNRIELAGASDCTAATDVVRRFWLLIDFDPIRLSNVSATNAEHALAKQRMEECQAWLVAEGVPEPIVADSGNGFHLLIRIELPNDEVSRNLIESVLRTVALKFGDNNVCVDVSVGKAAQLCKLYGTIARKGDSVLDRPHRFSSLIHVPNPVVVAGTPVLEKIAAMAPTGVAPSSPQGRGRKSNAIDVDDWAAQHGLSVGDSIPWLKGARKWILPTCPWNPAHIDRSAYIVQHASGAVAAGCLHNSCHGKCWADLRDVVEPDWRLTATADDDSNDHLNLKTVRLDTVQAESVEWVWHPYMAKGKISLWLGDPDAGKSSAVAAVAAALTTGAALPLSAGTLPASDVLIFTTEDGLGDTVRPRIEKAGGDLTRVRVLGTPFTLDRKGLEFLANEMKVHSPLVVFIDPLSGYAGHKLDLNRANQTRPLFSALAGLAAAYHCAIVVVAHPNKAGSLRALYRTSGSLDIVAACRTVLLFGGSLDDPQNRAMVPIKSNLAERGKPVGYRIEQSGLVSTGASTMTADDILGGPLSGDDALREATDFLQEKLATGPCAADALISEGRARGLSLATLRRAADRCGVDVSPVHQAGKKGVHHWEWRLPTPVV